MLQEQEFERLGSNRTLRVDVTIVAATNRNLLQMVDGGAFRSDLYYRLNIFSLTLPPVRERREDIPLLVRFAQKYAKKLNRGIEEIPSEALDELTRYSWPRNIRELQDLVERSVILSRGPLLQIDVPAAASIPECCALRNDDTERERVLDALHDSCGKIGGGPRAPRHSSA